MQNLPKEWKQPPVIESGDEVSAQEFSYEESDYGDDDDEDI